MEAFVIFCFAIIVLIVLAIQQILPVLGVIVLSLLIIGTTVGIVVLGFLIYESLYFKSKNFFQIKRDIEKYVNECNALNQHIEHLKNTYHTVYRIDYGASSLSDDSSYHFQRPEWDDFEQRDDVYPCSLNICMNAQRQPFKYLCKYFNISINEETLTKFEETFNAFSAAEQGKKILKAKKQDIIQSVSNRIPHLIKIFSKRKISEKLGFKKINFSKAYFPKYTFQYISPGGNSSAKCEIVFDLENLEKFINYLSQEINRKKSTSAQRALMTSRLREKIKERDGYTCQECGVSTDDEPHLLLEIDHIIPISKNGLTTEDNLRTLCWKCNRAKGARLI